MLTIANVLPPDMDAPDWGTREPRGFERFLNERFPRSMFPEFREMVDEGPDLMKISGVKPGMEVVHPGHYAQKRKDAQTVAARSKLSHYRFIVEIRAYWRAAARILAIVVVGSRPRPPLLRICEGCGVLFIARRANQMCHTKACGSRVRMARSRAKSHRSYEYQRKTKGRPDGKRKAKKKITKRNPPA
jgi:hypothetical protein